MNLGDLGTTAGAGIELDDDTIKWSCQVGSLSPKYNKVFVDNIVMGPALTEMIRLTIPAEKKAILLAAALNPDKTLKSAPSINVQLEIDGVNRVNEAYTHPIVGMGIVLIGNAVENNLNDAGTLYSVQRENSVSNIVFRDSVVIRASGVTGKIGIASLTYILVKG